MKHWIVKHDQPSPEHREAVRGPLAAFNAANGYPVDTRPVAVLLNDDEGRTVEGLLGADLLAMAVRRVPGRAGGPEGSQTRVRMPSAQTDPPTLRGPSALQPRTSSSPSTVSPRGSSVSDEQFERSRLGTVHGGTETSDRQPLSVSAPR